MQTAIHLQAGDMGAKHASVAANVSRIKHTITTIIFRDQRRIGCLTRREHQQNRNLYAGFPVAQCLLSLIYGMHPAGSDIGRMHKLPLRIIHPFPMIFL